MLFFLTSRDSDGGNEGERGNAGGASKLVQDARFLRRHLDYRHPCRVRRHVPASAFMRGARSCSLVSAHEDGASSRGLCRRVRGFFGRTWPSGGGNSPRTSPTMLLPSGSYSRRAGQSAFKGRRRRGRVGGDFLTWNARCMGLAGTPWESLMLPKLHPRLSIC